MLASLVQQFQDDGNCRGKKITMLSGGDADGLDPAVTASAPGTGQVSVIYTDLFNLNKYTPAFQQSYQQTLSKLDPSDIRPGRLVDGHHLQRVDGGVGSHPARLRGGRPRHP